MNDLFRDDSYKHLIFQEQAVPHRKNEMEVHVFNKHDLGFLGSVRWFHLWGKYCFFPQPECVFHDGCLQKIAEVCTKLTKGETK